MTRVLFACWPFEGHAFPQLSIARALRERGDAVAFCTGERVGGAIAGEGFERHPLRRSEGAWRRVHERERAIGGRRQSLRVQREAFRAWLIESIPDQVDDLRAAMAGFAPDVIVSDASMWGAPLVLSEAEPIPVATGSPLIYAVLPGPDAPPPGSRLTPPRTARGRALAWAVGRATDLLARGARARVDELRDRYGLPPLDGSINEQLGRLPLYLVGSIPELDFERRDLPPSVRYVGPLLWHPPEPPGTAAWLDALPADRPWVHVTEGTSHLQDPFVLRAAATGLAGAPYEAILTTGPRRAAAEIPAAAPNVHVRDWLSHEVLLPRCAAFVTTGGAGSTMGGLRAGVPIVIVPTTWDKPDVARRIVDAGVGLRLAPRRCTPAGLRAAVDELLADPGYARRAGEIARRLARAPGPAGAARLISELAPAPVPAPVGEVAR